MNPAKTPLPFAVVIAGISTMAIEMVASRLLAPFYGTSHLIWMGLLFAILLSLTIGYAHGGKLADRDPRVEPLARTFLAASVMLSLLPWVGREFLQWCNGSMNVGLMIMGAIVTIIMICVPVGYLARVGPYVIRLRANSPELMGSGMGTVLALSTIGSIFGTYLPAVFLIPVLGTIRSFLFLAMLCGVAAFILGTPGARRTPLFLGILLPIALFIPPPGLLRRGHGIIYEGESVYNTVQVKEDMVGEAGFPKYKRHMLILNEGYAVHSVATDKTAWCYPLVGSVWDYMGLLPCLNEPPGPNLDVGIVGLAGGTVANQMVELYKNFYKVRVEGAELDPLIIQTARTYFGMPGPEKGVNVYAQDGRNFLKRSKNLFDIIVTDAYRQPYIPFHLTTVEYFSIVKAHLKPRGICSINVGSTSTTEPLLAKIFSTMKTVFPEVYLFEVPRVTPLFANFLVLASREKGVIHPPQPPAGGKLGARLAAQFPRLPINGLLSIWVAHMRQVSTVDSAMVLTDDLAPVEYLVHNMIIRAVSDPTLKLDEISH